MINLFYISVNLRLKMEKFAKSMVSAEISIEELLRRYDKMSSVNAYLIKKNKAMESQQQILQDQIKKLMGRVQQALFQIDKGS